MKEYADTAKYYGQNGFTKEAWNHMSSRLNTQFPKADFTIVQIKHREQRLKKDYNIVKSILNKSGFGWDPVQKVPESIDEKWDELSKEQRKWRYKAFPHYDDLHGIYDGKTAEGKRCKGQQIFLRAAGLNSPTPTIPGLGLDGHQYDWDRGLYGDDVEFPSAAHSQGVENPSSQFDTEENHTIPDQPPKRYQPSKGSEERRPKKSKESAIDNLVAFRKEELQTDPDNDPYCIAKCIAKVKTVEKLSPCDRLKIIESLTEHRTDRKVFMTVDDE
ncbi:hypothetical protein BRADI_2g45653v3, partial [Brachypodium distachyon]